MELKLLKQAAHSSVLLMLVVIAVSVAVAGFQKNPGYAMAMGEDAKDLGSGGEAGIVHIGKLGDEGLIQPQGGMKTEDILARLGESYLMIPKNSGESGSAALTEQYVYRTVELRVDKVTQLSWAKDSVIRVKNGEEFTGEPDPSGLERYMYEFLYLDEEPADENALVSGNGAEEEEPKEGGAAETADLVQEVRVSYDEEAGIASMSITLNHLYVPVLYEDERYYYIDLKRPKEVYDKVVVMDAGHGGKHPGTMSRDGAYMEKDFNLAIMKEVKKLMDGQEEIKVYYTRLDDSSVYLRPRVNLANDVEADYFISIHNNAYENSSAYGTEVLYNELHNAGKTVDSCKLAALCLEEITGLTGTRSRGVQMSSPTYIIGQSNVPVALIELGYLTNPDDLAMLQDEKNLVLAAQGIYNAIMRAYEIDEEGE